MRAPFGVLAAFTVLLVALGGGPAVLLSGRARPRAVAIAPAAAAGCCALAVTAAVATSTSMLPWLVALALAGWAAALAGRRSALVGRPVDDPAASGAALAASVATALLPLVLVSYPATGTDARGIWWLHAAWFRAGGAEARAAMDNPALVFTHPSYPPVVPGVIAAVWHGYHAYDREAALRIGQVLTASGAAALGWFTAVGLRLRGRALVLTAMAVTWLGWSAKVELGLQGLYDLTWALFLATAAVLLLAGTPDRRTAITGALFAGVAALTKTEAQFAALLLLGLTVLRHRSHLRRSVPAIVAVVGGLGLWALIIRPNASERGDWSKLTDLLDVHSDAHERLRLSMDAFRGELGLMVAAGVLLVLAIVLLARWAKVPLDQPGLVALLLLALGYLVFTVVTFTVRPEALDFLLSVTAYRTAVVIRLVVMVDVVLAVVAAGRALDLFGGQGSGVANGADAADGPPVLAPHFGALTPKSGARTS